MKVQNVNHKLLKRIGAFALSAVALGSAIIYPHISKKSSGDMPVTTYNVFIDEVKKGTANTVLLNMGNHIVKGKSDELDIIRASKKNVPVGLIINTIASNKSEIYKDVEYVKYLLSKYDINYPVYLDVDRILSQESLRIDEMFQLITSFCTTLDANKVFVGICGSEDNINILKKNDTNKILSEYDTLIMKNNKNLDLEHSVSSIIKQSEDGSFYTNLDIESIIGERNLNNKDNFKYDNVYEVKDGDKVSDIAFSNGLSVEDLLSYNNLSLEHGLDGVNRLRIPTSYYNDLFAKKFDPVILDEPIVGIDISYYQSHLNWEEIKQKCSFVIMKSNQGESESLNFSVNAKKCMDYNIPMGVYCFNNYGLENGVARTDAEFKLLQENQAFKTIECISNKNIQLPVYLDHELSDILPDSQYVIMLDVWYDLISNAGYLPGLYASKSQYKNLKRAYDSYYGEGSLDSKFELWIAGCFDGIDYDAEYHYSQYESGVVPTDFSSEKYDLKNPSTIQASQKGLGFGDKGYVDVNFSYKDYTKSNEPKIDISDDLAEYLTSEKPNQKLRMQYDIEQFIDGNASKVSFCGGLTLGLSLGLIAFIKTKKNIKRKSR